MGLPVHPSFIPVLQAQPLAPTCPRSTLLPGISLLLGISLFSHPLIRGALDHSICNDTQPPLYPLLTMLSVVFIALLSD